MLTHAKTMMLKPEQLLAIRELQKSHARQDKMEMKQMLNGKHEEQQNSENGIFRLNKGACSLNLNRSKLNNETNELRACDLENGNKVDTSDEQLFTIETNSTDKRSEESSLQVEMARRNNDSEIQRDDQQNLLEECEDEESNSAYVSGNISEGFEDPEGAALWDIFRRQDISKLEDYLRKRFKEFRHTYGRPLSQVILNSVT